MSEARAREVRSWEPPKADGRVLARQRRHQDPVAAERELWESGFAAGRAAEQAERAERPALSALLKDQARRLAAILDLLESPLEQLSEQVQTEMAALSGAIARQIVRRELRTQPDEIVATVRATLALLPLAARDVRVHLHPEDAALVRELLPEAERDSRWRISEDALLIRGGCRVSSEHSTIDARVEQRVGAAIAAALGDERAVDRGGSTPGGNAA